MGSQFEGAVHHDREVLRKELEVDDHVASMGWGQRDGLAGKT